MAAWWDARALVWLLIRISTAAGEPMGVQTHANPRTTPRYSRKPVLTLIVMPTMTLVAPSLVRRLSISLRSVLEIVDLITVLRK